jgi:membrane protein implicated in regulation of membrane protease activity|eukprot:SAG25_NODE_311_length_10005_cov_9.395720_11_plen_117_part_00
MGAFDSIITLLLYACYGVYVVMGLCLLILGIVYMGDAGAIGTTGIWLCIVGFVMLIIGGIAIFANLKEIWILLLLIELINVVLFLVRVHRALHAPPPTRPHTQSYTVLRRRRASTS